MKPISPRHIVGIPALLLSLCACASSPGMGTPADHETTAAPRPLPVPIDAGTPPLPGVTSLGMSMPETRIALKGLPKDIEDLVLSLPPADFRATPDIWQYTVRQAIGGMMLIPRITGRPDRRISMVSSGDSALWIRTFESENPAITGYLIQVRFGCELVKDSPIQLPEGSAQDICLGYPNAWIGSGLRAYRKVTGQAIEDVTAQLTPPEQVLGEETMERYRQLGADGPFLDDSWLDRVPVARWIVESDPENPLPEDAHTYDGGYLAHANFLLWNGDHFETRATVPASLWPCPPNRPSSCIDDDRFVTKP